MPPTFEYSREFLHSNSNLHNKTLKKLLEINLDNNLKFDIHVESIYQKANRKLNALARIANYMELPKRSILMNAFFKSSILLLSCYLVAS